MEDEAQQPDRKLVQDLDLLSVDDLHERIAALHLEIKLCEAAIARKGSAKSAADALFSFGKND